MIKIITWYLNKTGWKYTLSKNNEENYYVCSNEDITGKINPNRMIKIGEGVGRHHASPTDEIVIRNSEAGSRAQ